MEHNLTKEEIRLIQMSWDTMTSKSKNTGEKFYANLFEKHSEMAELFKGDIKEQSGALMRMVKTVVEGLNNPQIIIPALQELGRRHSEYGVKNEYYKEFGNLLIETIGSELGNDFDVKTKTAWTKLYDTLADVMKN
jgi:hemoglobin-like flavoprotein